MGVPLGTNLHCSISENIEGNKLNLNLNLNLTFYIGHCKEYQASFIVLKT